jgi:rubrerythrin
MADVKSEVSRKDEAFQKRLPKTEDLNAMTEASLKAAFAGESQAAEKYMVFAEQAEDEGLPNVAKLFRAISFAETRHARNHFRVTGGVGATADNLKAAFEGESFEIDEMYPAYQEIAKVQKNTQAGRSIKYALKAEMDHKWMYDDARRSVLEGKDVADRQVSVCLICGHTVIGDVPDKCPVCAAAKEYYKTF